jgi:hypothetical protein
MSGIDDVDRRIHLLMIELGGEQLVDVVYSYFFMHYDVLHSISPTDTGNTNIIN